MCGRFTVLTRAEVEAAVRAVEGRQALAPLASGSARTQARPRQVVPVFTEVFDIKDLVWGFMFPWSKSPVFNTRIESILSDSATWREAVREGRCVIPAAGFFEPHATETVPSPRTGKAIKRPYEFAAVDGADFAENSMDTAVTSFFERIIEMAVIVLFCGRCGIQHGMRDIPWQQFLGCLVSFEHIGHKHLFSLLSII